MKLFYLLEATKEERVEYYKWHIKNHEDNIHKAWNDIQPKLKGEYYISDATKKKIEELLDKHDASKSGPEEFEQYRRYRYPADNEEKKEDDYKKAYEHHRQVNPHHWEYWNGKKIPFIYLMELLCDWKAIAIKKGGSPIKFYEDHKDEIKFHPDTKKEFDKWIKLFL